MAISLTRYRAGASSCCLQGETLQVYTLPVRHQIEGPIFNGPLCCFDGKLLAPVRDWRSSIAKEVVALCGV